MNIIEKEIKKIFEKYGLYIFFISLFLFTQFRWVKRHESLHNFELKFFGAFLAGLVIANGTIKLLTYFASKSKIKNKELFLKETSLALTPGIFFLFASNKSYFFIIGLALCVFFLLYYNSPLREFIHLLIYEDKVRNELIIKDKNAIIKVIGRYEKANPEIMQYYLSDLAINFHECSETEIKEVKIDFSEFEEQKEELKKIIESIAGYFDIKISYLSSL